MLLPIPWRGPSEVQEVRFSKETLDFMLEEGMAIAVDAVLERLEIDAPVEEAEDRLLDGAMAVECCAGCGWWHESALMEVSEEHQGPACHECEPGLFE